MKTYNSIDEYLQENPLTQDEVKRGQALRIVRARWGHIGFLDSRHCYGATAFKTPDRIINDFFSDSFSYAVLHLCAKRPLCERPNIEISKSSPRRAKILQQFALPYEKRRAYVQNMNSQCDDAQRNAARDDALLNDVQSVNVQSTHTQSAATWYVAEAEVILCGNVNSFTLKCDRARASASRECTHKMQHAFYKEIENVSCNDDLYEKWFFKQRESYDVAHMQEEIRARVQKSANAGANSSVNASTHASENTSANASAQNNAQDAAGPLMSIVMPAYHTPPAFLRDAIDSILAQVYENWELVIVNASPDDEEMASTLAAYTDARIKVVQQPHNDGIVGNTNLGIEHTKGDYICFLDHDDFVEPEALLFYVDAITRAAAENTHVCLLYCDEDSYTEEGVYHFPFFKPDFNIDLILSNNYIVHWLCVSRRVINEMGKSGAEVEGAQDYDLTLKAACLCDAFGNEIKSCVRKNEKSKPCEIVHIPHVLYHWRMHSGSVNANFGTKTYAMNAGRVAVKNFLNTHNIQNTTTCEPAMFTYRALYEPNPPKSLDVFLVGAPCELANFSQENIALKSHIQNLVQEYKNAGGDISFYALPHDTPQTRQTALERSNAHVVAFLPYDMAALQDNLFYLRIYAKTFCVPIPKEPNHNGFLTLAGYFARGDVGAASPRVMRFDGLAEYNNITVSGAGNLICMNRYLTFFDEGYQTRSVRPLNPMVLYARAVFLDRTCALACGGFSTDYETLDFSFANLCMKMRAQGKHLVYSPFAVLKRSRFETQFGTVLSPSAHTDREKFVRAWRKKIEAGDPCFNPNLDRECPYYRL